MKFAIFSVFLLNAVLAVGQKAAKKAEPTQEQIIKKWLKTVVSLEIRVNQYRNYFQSYMKSLGIDSVRKMTPKVYNKIMNYCDSIARIYVSETGTAIFLKVNARRYLITARHVVCDSSGQINPTIYLSIQPKGELETKPVHPPMMLSLTGYQYICSSQEDDIAIISLNIEKECTRFADFLEQCHYLPISTTDIDSTCHLKYGQDLISIGFPFFSRASDRDSTWRPMESIYRFVPAVTFGKVAVLFKNLFVGDVNVAPGNSGGPVISNNKLIGIVSSQPRYALEEKNGSKIPNEYYRILYAFASRSSLIMPLFKRLVDIEDYVIKTNPNVTHVN